MDGSIGEAEGDLVVAIRSYWMDGAVPAIHRYDRLEFGEINVRRRGWLEIAREPELLIPTENSQLEVIVQGRVAEKVFSVADTDPVSACPSAQERQLPSSHHFIQRLGNAATESLTPAEGQFVKSVPGDAMRRYQA